MKYLSLPSFDVVTSALNFDTPDCHVTGSCDLYTTKAAGSDKKLYKNIQQSLESQHAALVKFGASLSPPQRDSMAASLNLSRSSPFGSLEEIANRRTYAYLIATLNASHPDYDFSHVLRPADFQRERVLRRVMTHIDSTLTSIRPNSTLLDAAVPHSHHGFSPARPTDFFNTGISTAPAWGPQMWAAVDKEMHLKDCTVFSYQPADDPFDEEEGAIWALHYFFFNKALKRVCYLYVRGVPVMSHSPRVTAHTAAAAARRRRERGLWGGGVETYPGVDNPQGGVEADDADDYDDNNHEIIDDEDDDGATKRARFWLGDKFAERVMASDDDMDDGLVWNRDADGDVNYQYDEDDDDDDEMFQQELEEEERSRQQRRTSSGTSAVRGVSEDIAARMEIDV
ncbi:Maf1 regulator-domain-containing protein [Chaetomium sp. MPI-SDFR-AT-0129]|nr:Maf1 regulator-domain-containing protein [Chaetomium sp. MPI-SDFR-AT-0129]